MLDLDIFNDLYLTLSLAVPGLIVLFVRSQFVPGRSSSPAGMLLNYCTVSIIYYALAFLFVNLVLSIDRAYSGNVWAWFILIIVGPAVLGLLLGINIQWNLFHRMLQKCGLNLVHAVPTAWDWKFGNMAPPMGFRYPQGWYPLCWIFWPGVIYVLRP